MRKALMVLGLFVFLPLFTGGTPSMADGSTEDFIIHPDLYAVEKADPYKDLKVALAKNDFRFVAVRGFGIYIPGVSVWAKPSEQEDAKFELKVINKHGYRIIEGTSDFIMNYEHGRLITIAQYYADQYNTELMEYLEELYAKEEAIKLEGSTKALKVWKIDDSMLGYFNGYETYAVSYHLSASYGNLVNSARWYNELKDGIPLYDWNDFIAVVAEAEGRLSKQIWLLDWKKISDDRNIEIWVYGDKLSSKSEVETFVLPAWKHAGLDGVPDCMILLRVGDKAYSTLYLGPNENSVLITSSNPFSTDFHWLDRLEFMFHPTQEVPQYIVVKENGVRRISGLNE